MIRYRDDFNHSSQDTKYALRPLRPGTLEYIREEPAPDKAGVDDPAGSLRQFITTVENSLGEGDVGEGFAKVKTLLLEAIETPFLTVKAV